MGGLSENWFKVKKVDWSTGESSFPPRKKDSVFRALPFSDTLDFGIPPSGSHRCPQQSRDQGGDQRLLMAPLQVTLQKILGGRSWMRRNFAMGNASHVVLFWGGSKCVYIYIFKKNMALHSICMHMLQVNVHVQRMRLRISLQWNLNSCLRNPRIVTFLESIPQVVDLRDNQKSFSANPRISKNLLVPSKDSELDSKSS